MLVLACFLCCQGMPQRTSKRGKPYFVCDACGIQIFVRRKQGMEKLEAFFANMAKTDLQFEQHAQHFREMQAVLKKLQKWSKKLTKSGFHIFLVSKNHASAMLF